MPTPDMVWKAPVTTTEEFDLTMALRLAAVAHAPIAATTLEAYWAQWDDPAIAEDVAHAPGALVDEYAALSEGTAHLRLPDGARWIQVSVLLNTDLHEGDPGDNAFLRRVHALLLEHKVLRGHVGPALPDVLLQAETLDVQRVFCTEPECRRWVDLQADAGEADATLSPWED